MNMNSARYNNEHHVFLQIFIYAAGSGSGGIFLYKSGY